MVTISRSIALIAAAAAATTGLIQASPLKYNPYTAVDSVPLTASHPAFGGKVNDDCVQPTIPEDPNQAVAESMVIQARKLRRMEESHSSDITDLEKYFGESMEVNFNTLKEKYASTSAPTSPWPSSYWPSYQDGINFQWKQGEPSASEKYATAYGKDVTKFMDQISLKYGVDSQQSTPCSTDTDCNGNGVCAKRAGKSTGYCIPTWHGICHAWSPAAILEQEPQCDVEKNGVTFHVFDIKALLSEMYAEANLKTVFTGARYNGPEDRASKDQFGRYTDQSRRDLGAGYFHIALTNIMGKHQQSFVVDISAGPEVWNQPARSYEVQTMELVDVGEASQKYFGTSSYPFNSEMVYLAYTQTTFSYISEDMDTDGPMVSSGGVSKYTQSKNYEYLLELDANYNIIGGEWLDQSKADHPDFLWFPTQKPDSSLVTDSGLSVAEVQELHHMSLSCSSGSSSTPQATTQSPGIVGDGTPASTAGSNGDDGAGFFINLFGNNAPAASNEDNVVGVTPDFISLAAGSKDQQEQTSSQSSPSTPTSQPNSPQTPVVTPPGGNRTPSQTIPIVPSVGSPTTSTPSASTPDFVPNQQPTPNSPEATPAPSEPTVHFVC